MILLLGKRKQRAEGMMQPPADVPQPANQAQQPPQVKGSSCNARDNFNVKHQFCL